MRQRKLTDSRTDKDNPMSVEGSFDDGEHLMTESPPTIKAAEKEKPVKLEMKAEAVAPESKKCCCFIF